MHTQKISPFYSILKQQQKKNQGLQEKWKKKEKQTSQTLQRHPRLYGRDTLNMPTSPPGWQLYLSHMACALCSCWWTFSISTVHPVQPHGCVRNKHNYEKCVRHCLRGKPQHAYYLPPRCTWCWCMTDWLLGTTESAKGRDIERLLRGYTVTCVQMGPGDRCACSHISFGEETLESVDPSRLPVRPANILGVFDLCIIRVAAWQSVRFPEVETCNVIEL